MFCVSNIKKMNIHSNFEELSESCMLPPAYLCTVLFLSVYAKPKMVSTLNWQTKFHVH